MTLELAFTPITEPEVEVFTEKLELWAAGLSARERHILDALLADADARDVHGYSFTFAGFGGGFGPPLGPLGGTFGGTAAPDASPPTSGAGHPPNTGAPIRQV